MSIYCGNNASNSDLLNGKSVLGTRLGCLRKGYGKGINMPYDPNYEGEFTPIDDTKIYCGNNDILPGGYARAGNLPECLQKGIGLGKKARVRQGKPKIVYKVLYWVAFLIVASSIALTIRFTKPNIIKNKDNEKIDEVRYTLLVTLITVFLFLLFFYIKNFIFY